MTLKVKKYLTAQVQKIVTLLSIWEIYEILEFVLF